MTTTIKRVAIYIRVSTAVAGVVLLTVSQAGAEGPWVLWVEKSVRVDGDIYLHTGPGLMDTDQRMAVL